MWLRLCGLYVSLLVSLNSIQIAADKTLSLLVAEKYSYVSLTVCICHCVCLCVSVYVHVFRCAFLGVRVCVHSIYSKHLSDWLTWSLDRWEECCCKHRNADLFPCWRRVSFFVISYCLDMCLVVGLLDDSVALFLILGRNTHPSF